MPQVVPPACITGRFQPFHVEHRQLVMHVLDRHPVAYVGIGGAVGRDEVGPDHRDADNPFTYWQRAAMIHASLDEVDIDRHRYEVVPFPTMISERWLDFVPGTAIHYVRGDGEWERRKVALLRSVYSVETIPTPGHDRLSATAVRESIAAGEGRWRDWVGSAVAELIEEWA